MLLVLVLIGVQDIRIVRVQEIRDRRYQPFTVGAVDQQNSSRPLLACHLFDCIVFRPSALSCVSSTSVRLVADSRDNRRPIRGISKRIASALNQSRILSFKWV